MGIVPDKVKGQLHDYAYGDHIQLTDGMDSIDRVPLFSDLLGNPKERDLSVELSEMESLCTTCEQNVS